MSFKVISLEEKDGGFQLTLKGHVDLDAGSWALLRFEDGSGRALRLGTLLSTSKLETVFSLQEDPGLRVDEGGMHRIAFPPRAVSGMVTLKPLGSMFIP
jgi:hypothetical protein